MSAVLHCDECGTWGRGTMAAHFIHVTEEDSTLHFCLWDCLIRHAARKEPVTHVP